MADPEVEWSGGGSLRAQLAEWTRQRGKSPRLYPGALVWCLKKPGRDLRDKVELGLAWKRVAREVADGTLGGEFDKSDRAELQSKVKDAEEAAKDEVWGDYRFAVVADGQEPDGLKVIDLGAGHSRAARRSAAGSSPRSSPRRSSTSPWAPATSTATGRRRSRSPGRGRSRACGRASSTARSRGWSIRTLILRSKIVEFVGRGDFGLASGRKADGGYERVWFQEPVAPDEVAFEAGVFLLRKATAEALKSGASRSPLGSPSRVETGSRTPEPEPEPVSKPAPGVNDQDPTPRGHRPPGGLEPPRDEDPSETPVRLRAHDRRGVLGIGQRDQR